MPYYLISTEDADALRLALADNPEALHTLDSGLHTTHFAPPAQDGPLSADEFARTYLDPVALEAGVSQIALYALAVEVIDEEDDNYISVGNRVTVTQQGPDDAYHELLKDVLGEDSL